MALTADAQGVVTGKFRIPKGIKAGTKPVTFTGNQQSHGESTFTGQGTVVTNTMRKVNNIQRSYYDPLAQTFIMPAARQLSAVNIWVTKVGTTDLIVQLRETSVGFPTREIVAEGRVSPANITPNTWTKVTFDTPFYASANIEYAVVVMANDEVMSVGISELGKIDATTKSYVTTQPYQVGVLLSSANASTWTAHQDKDLTFQLFSRRYNPQNPKTVILGNITVPAGTTDFLVSALTSTPATGADADLELIEYDYTDPTAPRVLSTRTVSDGQVVKLTSPTSGVYEVRANLRCTDFASATIEPGSQIIAGALGGTGEYISRSFPMNKGNAFKLTVTLEAINPGALKVDYGLPPTAGGNFNWVPLTHDTKTTPDVRLDNGHTEQTWTASVPAAASASASGIKLRLTLSGSASSRPQIFNLRASVV
ncbi:hypothetical protein LT875_002431 [Salmonella enterica]|nr:hypothetical protein [Salmonella enterica]